MQAAGAGGKPLRVLHVLTSDQRRGAETSALALAEELDRRGHRSTSAALQRSPDEPRLDVQVLGHGRPLSAPVLRRLRREAAAADVVIAHGSRTLPACALALAGGGTPFLYANIGDPLFWANTRRRRARVRLMLARAHGVAALADDAAAVLQSAFGVPAQRLRVIPNGRQPQRFSPCSGAERRVLRDRLGLPQDRPVVLALGALAPEKRLDIAVDAVTRVPSALLVVAGEGPERPRLERLATERGAQVRFTGQVEDVASLLAASDVLLLTSDSEGLPGVLIEAGLSGVPAVATDVGYVRDIVLHGRTGHLVPRGDAAAAAAAVRTVLLDAARLGEQALEHCTATFGMGAVAAQWEDFCRSVVEGGTSRPLGDQGRRGDRRRPGAGSAAARR